MAPRQLGRDYEHGYAIVRLDGDGGGGPVGPQHVTVTRVLATLNEAEAEVARLNELAAGKGHGDTTTYFWQTTRVYGPQTDDR